MRPLIFLTLLAFVAFFPLIQKAHGQPVPRIKGLYVDGFDKILGDTRLEDSLLRFAQDNNFNYLTLYRLNVIGNIYDLSTLKGGRVLARFIQKAKTKYGTMQIGGAGENFYFFRDVLDVYNQQHSDTLQKIDVYNLEFEFWVPNAAATVYCSQYLDPEGYTCDTSGAFSYYIKSLFSIDSLAHLSSVLSETYIGWANASQTRQVGNTCDRVLLMDYVQNDKALYSYAQKRLHYLRACTKKVTILPIFSAEGGASTCGTTEFMGSWLDGTQEDQVYTSFMSDYNASAGVQWKKNVDIAGYQWFDYSCLRTNANSNLKIVTGQGVENQEKVLKISNLEDGRLRIQINSETIGTAIVQINGMQGNLIFSQAIDVEKSARFLHFQLDGIVSGVYIVRVFLPDGSVSSLKWMK